MVHLITEYAYDWEAFAVDEIKKSSTLDFLSWFSKAGDVLQLDIETNVVDKLYDREVYVVQIGDKDAGETNGVSYGDQWVFDIPRLTETDLLLLKSILATKKKEWIIHNAAFEYTVLKMTFGIDLYKVLDTFLMSKIIYNGKETPPGFHGLAGCVKRECNGLEMSKAEQTSFKGAPMNVNQIIYAATDVAVMGLLFDVYSKKAKLDGVEAVIDLENSAVRAFGDIQTYGLHLDWDEWLSNADIFTQELEQVKSELNKMLFEPAMYTDCVSLGLIQDNDEYFFKWTSISFKREITKLVGLGIKPTLTELEKTKKVLKLISNPTKEESEQLTIIRLMLNKQYTSLELHLISNYDTELVDLEIKVLKDTLTFGWTQQIKRLQALQIIHPDLTSTSDQALSRLSSPIVRKYKEWAKKAKLVSSFGKTFEKYIEGDGKVRTSINQIMATGRISSRDPNLQNLPHVSKFRNPFKSDDSTKRLTIADYSSQEVLITATLSKEPAWLEGIEKGYDLHSYNASLIFDDWEDVAEDDCQFMIDKSRCGCKKHGEYRTSSKTITFGLIYGMGVMKLADTLDIDKTKAKELMNKFFSAFPTVEDFMDETKQSGIDNGYIETAPPYSRKRYFEIPRDKREEASIRRKSGNTVIQGTAADMVKLALALIKEELDTNPYWDDVQIKMQIHDEIICQASAEQAEEWAAKQVKIMEFAAEHILGNKLLKSTVIISDKWEK